MTSKHEQVEKILKESLLTEVIRNNKIIEDKLDEIMNENKSYRLVYRKSI